jgi:hypothetical protein
MNKCVTLYSLECVKQKVKQMKAGEKQFLNGSLMQSGLRQPKVESYRRIKGLQLLENPHLFQDPQFF